MSMGRRDRERQSELWHTVRRKPSCDSHDHATTALTNAADPWPHQLCWRHPRPHSLGSPSIRLLAILNRRRRILGNL